MRVAATDRDQPATGTKVPLPERERVGVPAGPRPVPDLDRVGCPDGVVLPGGPERLRMVDAHEGPGLSGRAHRAVHRGPVRLPELPPAVGAPGVPMTAVRRHLDPGDDDRQVSATGA